MAFEKTFKTLEMRTIFLLSLMMLSLSHQNTACAQTDFTTKVATQQQYHPTTTDAILNFTGTINNGRVLLNWTLDKNQAVDKIEVERSTDEKKFVMAGLVFGTDQSDKMDYIFYEKNKKVKLFYRLKVINKDLTVIYSSTITPGSAPVAHL